MVSTHTIEYEETRCYTCGSYYAVEKNRGIRNVGCPFCTAQSRERLGHELKAAHRAVNALKGLLKKKG